MSFARPDLLWWLFALALIPLLYLARRRARRVMVPHLFIWERVLDREGKARLNRLRDLLGMFLQIAIAGTLVVAWAGPLDDGDGRARGRIDLVVDVSASMAARRADGRSRAEAAVAAVRERLDDLLMLHDVGVVALGDGMRRVIAPTGEADEVIAAMERLPAPHGDVDVDVLRRWIATERVGDAVVLVGDLAGATGEELAAMLPTERVLAVGDARRNAGIVAVSTAGDAATVTLVAHGGAAGGRLRLIAPDGVEAESVQVALASGETRAVDLALPAPDESGFWSLVFDGGEPDALDADDRVDVFRPAADRARVLVVANAVDPRLKTALGVLEEHVDAAAAGVAPPDAWREVAERYDLIILQEVEERAPLPPGRFLLLDAWAPGLPLLRRGETDLVRELEHRETGPVLRGLDLGDLAIGRAEMTETSAGAETVLAASSGTLISVGAAGPTRFVHLAFSPFETNSSLTLLPAWPLLLKDVIEHLVAPEHRVLPGVVAAGDLLVLGDPIAPDAEPPRPLARRPGSPDVVEPLRSAGSPMAWRAPAAPGPWEILWYDRIEPIQVADVGPARSYVLPRATSAAAMTPPPAPRETHRTEGRAALFIGLALLFLLVEWAAWNLGWTS